MYSSVAATYRNGCQSAIKHVVCCTIRKRNSVVEITSEFLFIVEITGLEPVTSTLPVLRSSQMS
ncbi:MAG: hypothetical protein PWQ71_1260 [Bacteroidota bacterium]|jgi:hypothetical protein|nr:hypothetical protein [Bacteroidota bacterium]